MPQIINTNTASINAQRNLTRSQSDLAVSLQRLSSGLRINSAKDDAAGLAISDRMTTVIRGSQAALRNVNDGVSLLQVADESAGTVVDNLQRIRELAIQSANSTYTLEDRMMMQVEVNQLFAASFEVQEQTEFNGNLLFDGNFVGKSFHVGANSDEIVSVSLPKLFVTNYETTYETVPVTEIVPVTTTGPVTTTESVTVTEPDTVVTTVIPGKEWAELATTPTAQLSPGDLVINGVSVGASVAGTEHGQTADSTWAITNAITAANISDMQEVVVSKTQKNGGNISVSYNDFGSTSIPSSESIPAGAIELNGIPIGEISAANGSPINTRGGFLREAETQFEAAVPGIDFSPDAGEIFLGNVHFTKIYGLDGINLDIQETVSGSLAKLGFTSGITRGVYVLKSTETESPGTPIVISGNHPEYAGLTAGTYAVNRSTPDTTTTTTIPGETTTTEVTTTTQVTTTTNTTVTTDKTIATTKALPDPNTDVLTQENAEKMIEYVDSKINHIDSVRGYAGAILNRFSSISSNLSVTIETASAARSRIQDTDFAAETAELTRNQILQQAGTAMLAQANQLPQGVLSLLQS